MNLYPLGCCTTLFALERAQFSNRMFRVLLKVWTIKLWERRLSAILCSTTGRNWSRSRFRFLVKLGTWISCIHARTRANACDYPVEQHYSMKTMNLSQSESPKEKVQISSSRGALQILAFFFLVFVCCTLSQRHTISIRTLTIPLILFRHARALEMPIWKKKIFAFLLHLGTPDCLFRFSLDQATLSNILRGAIRLDSERDVKQVSRLTIQNLVKAC